MTEYLFSYGTLQLSKVQLENFGRILEGEPDVLSHFKLSSVEITDEEVLKQSGQSFHPIAIPSEDEDDKIKGMVFKISHEELLRADSYEVDDYARVAVDLESGKKAWIYISKEYI